MKKERVPFDLRKIGDKNYKVVSRDGYNVTILTTDRKRDNYPIVVIEHNEKEEVIICSSKGVCYGCDEGSRHDLLLERCIFEDGDIVSFGKDNSDLSFIGIFMCYDEGNTHRDYATLTDTELLNSKTDRWTNCNMRLATTDEVDKLLDTMNDQDLRWNSARKCLEVSYKRLNPKDWCLMRDTDSENWILCRFSHISNGSYMAVGGLEFNQCILYEGNEHLLGTNKNKIWKV